MKVARRDFDDGAGVCEVISFFADGIPKPQPRPRARRMGKFIRMYNPGSANDWRGCVIAAATGCKLAGESLSGDLSVTLSFLMPVAKSNERKKLWGQWCRGRGDADNLAKPVLDALVDCGVIATDMDVVRLTVEKRWQLRNGSATGCRVEIAAA